MKRNSLFAILAVTSALCEVSTVSGSGELIPYQFTNCGVEFGHKEIPIKAKRNTLSIDASLPTSDAPQRVLQVEHPDYVREKVFKKAGAQDGRERV